MARSKNSGWNQRTAAVLAWNESKVTADVHHLLGEVRRGTVEPPRGFIDVELGFGLLEGPSLIATLQDLERTNKAHRHLLAQADKAQRTAKAGPKRAKGAAKPRLTGALARRAIRATVARARSSSEAADSAGAEAA